jgi:hypothetical protein
MTRPGPDPCLDPASGVLRNVLGITDATELSQAEAALTASRHHIAWVQMNPEENEAASIAAHRGDLQPLVAMLDRLTDLPHPSGPRRGRLTPKIRTARCHLLAAGPAQLSHFGHALPPCHRLRVNAHIGGSGVRPNKLKRKINLPASVPRRSVAKRPPGGSMSSLGGVLLPCLLPADSAVR